MIRSLYSGVSGLRSHQTQMDVIGNNIANVNTTAFKRSRLTFKEQFVQTLEGATRPPGDWGGINPLEVGLGTTVNSIDKRWEQGSFKPTGKITDLAIDGDGLFTVSKGEQDFYTRAGNIQVDSQGRLVHPGTGYVYQGLMADEDWQIPSSGELGNIQLPIGSKVPAEPTSNVGFRCNLNANMTTSNASLIDADTTGITNVSGKAANGVGGTHNLTITGNNAAQSSELGTNAVGATLVGTEQLGSNLGVTDVTDLTVTLDGSSTVAIQGLTVNSTVNDLINAINGQVDGATAEIDSGEIRITREYAGAGGTYNVSLADQNGSDIVQQLFDGSGTFDVDNGTASTISAEDQFVANHGGYTYTENLQVQIDEDTGLATGIEGLGDGGVDINANNGLQAGTAEIETEDTVHSASIGIYDSLGEEHNLKVNFYRTPGENQWYWQADTGGSETIVSGGSGEVGFNSEGAISSFTYTSNVDDLTINPNNGGSNMNITLDPGTFGQFDGITQFDSPSTTVADEQDGYGMGILDEISIEKTGVIKGNFTNGISKNIAKIALAHFTNPAGLESEGGGLFRESSNSGEAVTGYATTTFADTIKPGSLESSNVDLSEEFTDMITTQRGFQANAKVITTSDEMLTELVNIKR